MAFGARNDSGWRLCHRKGITIHHVWNPSIQIVFKTQAKAKACADELNEKYWKQYIKIFNDESVAWPEDLWFGMLEVIHKHGGLSADNLKEIENAL